MNSNAENAVSLINYKPFNRKKHFVLTKENLNKENKMPDVEVTCINTDSPSYLRIRKHSENSFDQPLRRKGLQEIDTSTKHYVIPKGRNYSTDDMIGPKPLCKTRFHIFYDKQLNEDSKNRTTVKLKPITAEVRTEKVKESTVYCKSDCNASTLAQENKEDIRKSSLRQSNCRKIITSPRNLPHIPTVNPFKIKESHKNASSTKRNLKMMYDGLPPELAYNIDYINEYVRFQMEINEKKRISSAFLTKNVTADQRRLIVKYLISTTAYYKYPSFILYQTVKIFDAYIDTIEVNLNELQTVALAALWIALKKDSIIDEIPEASAMVRLAGNAFKGNKKPLIECEKKILMSLNFEISFAEPFSMLALYTLMIKEVRDLKIIKVQELYYCGSYLIDLSLLHDAMFNIFALHVAAISTEIALVLIMTANENVKNPQWSHWRNRVFTCNPSLQKYRLSEEKMNHIRNQLLQKALLSKDSKTDYHVVYKKYSTKRYGPVSNFLISKISSLFLEKIYDPLYSAQPILF